MQIHKLVVNNLDHQLAGLERFDHLLADGFLDDVFGEVIDDFEIDVSFQQGCAHFAHGFADVFFADFPPAGKGAEDAVELVG